MLLLAVEPTFTPGAIVAICCGAAAIIGIIAHVALVARFAGRIEQEVKTIGANVAELKSDHKITAEKMIQIVGLDVRVAQIELELERLKGK